MTMCGEKELFYVLQSKLQAHNSDVKSIAVIDSETIATSSRDTNTIIWKRSKDTGLLEPTKQLRTHSHYVNAIAFIPPNETAPKGMLATAGVSHEVHLHMIDNYDEPPIVLKAHTQNVCSLKVGKNGDLFSGSWDQYVSVIRTMNSLNRKAKILAFDSFFYVYIRTAIIWRNNQVHLTLKHNSAVWGLAFVSDNQYLTTSDKIITYWEHGVARRRYEGHEDCVRDVAILGENEFVTCSNDGTICIWALNSSNRLHVIRGHDSFIYSFCIIDDNLMASSGEDGTVRIWKKDRFCGYTPVQTIRTPSISVWCVRCTSNGDIISGGSDHIIYIFTTDLSRSAPDNEIAEFEAKSALNEDPLNANSRFKDSDLSDPSVLSNPGVSDGKVVLVKNGDKVLVHKWSELERRWDYIGEAVQSQVRPKHSKNFKGKEYDYVFDVHMEDTGAIYQLPFNLSDNPYISAHKFIQDNDLSPSHLEEIVDFINRSVDIPVIGSTQVDNTKYCDPYTGSSRYIPPTTQIPDVQNERHIIHSKKRIPMIDSSIKISDDELNFIYGVIDSAKNFRLGKDSLPALKVINDVIRSWPLENLFPYKDTHLNIIAILTEVIKILEKLQVEQYSIKDRTALYIFLGRTISNSFNPELECNLCIEQYPLVFNTALKLLRNSNNATLINTWISVILNYAVTIYKYPNICSESFCEAIYDTIVACFDLDINAENTNKIATALGTMLFREKDTMSKIKADRIKNVLSDKNFPRTLSDDVKQTMNEIYHVLNRDF